MNRLDFQLHEHYPHYSKTQWARFIRQELVLWRGKPVSKGLKVEPTDLVHFEVRWEEIRELTEWQIIPKNLPLALSYRDDKLAAYEKPSGLACHPLHTSESDSVVHRLAQEYPDSRHRQEGFLLNRIDTLTSGLVLWAVNEAEYLRLTPFFRRGSDLLLQKHYVALVLGHPTWNEIACEADLVSQGRRWVGINATQGSIFQTEFAMIERFTLRGVDVSLISCTLDHGRMHQVRGHLHILGYPLAGDLIYGPGTLAGSAELKGGHGLHCQKIEIAPCPLYSEGLAIKSNLPKWALISHLSGEEDS